MSEPEVLRAAHGLHIISLEAEEGGGYENYLAIMVTDSTPGDAKLRSEQFNLQFQPYMDPAAFAKALRNFADTIEQYHEETPIEMG